MKRILMLLLVLSVSFTFAQEERQLVLNEDTNLIEATFFHENGTISQTGFYTKAGKLHGKWFSYCKDGNKLISAEYNNGVKVGTWVYWMDDIIKEVDYSKNRIASVTDNYAPSRSALAKN